MYNRTVKVKHHRIDTPKKNLCYNMLLGCMYTILAYKTSHSCYIHFAPRLRAPIHLVELVHQHYDLYKHEESGILVELH